MEQRSRSSTLWSPSQLGASAEIWVRHTLQPVGALPSRRRQWSVPLRVGTPTMRIYSHPLPKIAHFLKSWKRLYSRRSCCSSGMHRVRAASVRRARPTCRVLYKNLALSDYDFVILIIIKLNGSVDIRVLCPGCRPSQLHILRPLLWVPQVHSNFYSYIVLSSIQLVILVACINLWIRDIKRRGGACINFLHSHQAIVLMLCSVFSLGKHIL